LYSPRPSPSASGQWCRQQRPGVASARRPVSAATRPSLGLGRNRARDPEIILEHRPPSSTPSTRLCLTDHPEPGFGDIDA
jgi:hypothetical protein